MALDGALLTKSNDRTADSVQQYQTARACSLIFLYSLREVNSSSRIAV